MLGLCGIAASAQDPIAELKRKPGETTLANALPYLADPAVRGGIRSAILGLDPFPGKEFVALLSHPQLAVRLGALEMLEEKAGGDYGYNPWIAATDPDNEAPLALWEKWLDGDDSGKGGDSRLLDDAQRHGYLRDLLAGDADKSSRARRMLEADGLGAVGFLENFIIESVALPAGSRAKVREAQYQIVLSPAFGAQASAMARHLAFGSRDQMLSALGKLKSGGLGTLPIIRDFLRHSDSLVRETAIDAMLGSGGSQALSIVGPVLADETDPNVIHGALRRIKEIPGDKSLGIAVSFLSREEEDLLISAIQACQKLAAGDANEHSSFGRASKAKKSEAGAAANIAVAKTLSDPRWRVRTAALEYVTAVKPKGMGQKCVELLEDEDEFVRYSAIKAATALGEKDAVPVLRKMFMANPETVGQVLAGYAALGSVPDDEMMEKLSGYPPDARVAAVQAAASNKRLEFLPIRFAADPDLDVSCAALRFLSSNSDRVDSPKIATVLVEALRSGVLEKRAAVLDRLALPKGEVALDPALASELGEYATPAEETILDPLYQALLGEAAKAAGAAADDAKVIPGAKGELMKEIGKVANSDDPAAFRASLLLGISGDPEALKILLGNLPKYSTAQRAAIAGKLYEPRRKEALELLSGLVRDPVDEVRSEAVESAFSAEDTPAFLMMCIAALSEPDSELMAHQLYSYRFESAARDQSTTGRALRSWASAAIKDATTPDPNRILALISVRQNLPRSLVDPVLSLAKSSPNKWVRRAAWSTLSAANSSAFSKAIDDLTEDPSAFVRAVLAEATSRMDSAWQHRFDDVHSVRDNSWFSGRSQRRLNSASQEALGKLAATDPSPGVRFEAMCSLLSHGREIDADAFAVLLRSRPEEDRASYRVADWMHDNLKRLGAGLAPVVSALNPAEIRPKYMSAILAKVATKGKKEEGFGSFSALAAGAGGDEEVPQLTGDEQADEMEAERESLRMVYFFKPGCAECEKAGQLLEAMKNDFPLLEVERHNINETESTLFNQALCARFQVPSADHQIAPALFTQASFLIRDDILPNTLGKLLSETSAMPQDDSWAEVGGTEIAAAKEKVEERYKSLTLPVVLLAGLIDGVNPCAFATIIFFLSYLQIARRTPREMLMVGIAFILAVFLAYFMAGLVLHSVLEKVTDHISGIKPYLDWAFAGLAIIAALISFRDAAKARAGKLDEMALTLPAFLKDRIRGVIRSGAKARRFVIGAFLAGIVISFLELACTGQVYAPIIYSIQQGKMDAVAWLFAYNLAFILPLIVIFALAFTGMSNKVLIDFQTRHTFSVKIALGIVFLSLAAVILFGAGLL